MSFFELTESELREVSKFWLSLKTIDDNLPFFERHKFPNIFFYFARITTIFLKIVSNLVFIFKLRILIHKLNLLRGLGSIEWLVGRHISLLWLDRESKKNRWKIFSKNFFEGLLSCMAVEVGVAIEGQKSNFGSSFVIFGARSMNEGSLERA